jgi:CDP-diacylglycerol--glycerol-3-phosphate 3-phosphatidyltransferase
MIQLMTLYDIKPKFQNLLRPIVRYFAAIGITANHVTIAAVIGSLVIGLFLYLNFENQQLFLLLPVWMFFRMALNAIDGMLAREFNQKSNLGAYLNELTDVIADAALFIPFALIAPFTVGSVILVIFLATLSEFTGVLGITVGASRRYDGPLGKSDRALLFGALALWIGLGGSMPDWIYWLMPFCSILITVTIYNRIKRALEEV